MNRTFPEKSAKAGQIHLRSSAALVALAVAGAVAATPAEARERRQQPAASDGLTRFQIDRQPLGKALMQLARQSGTEIAASSRVTRDRTSSAVSGAMPVAEALDRLLAGTGLTYRAGRGDSYVVEAPGEPARNEERGSARAERLAVADEVAQSPEIIVTGSRIARSPYNSPAPVVAVNEEAIERTGLNRTYDILERMPQFGVGIAPRQDTFGGAYGEVGANFLDLRDLGESRTLVLVDGQRRVSGSTTGSLVDVGTIPSNMIKRVEVMTGGAAAVYGADAVGGVVNFILKDDVDGLELNARQGISDRGDAHTQSYEAMLGGAIGDRGRFTLGATYSRDSTLPARKREFSDDFLIELPNPANTGPNDGIPDNVAVNGIVFTPLTNGGQFMLGGNSYVYDVGGARLQNNPGPAFFGIFAVGDDGFNPYKYTDLINESNTVSALAHSSYDLTDAITFKADLQFARSHGQAGMQPLGSGVGGNGVYRITRDNPFLPADLASLMDANGLDQPEDFIDINRVNEDDGRMRRDVTRTTWTAVAKLEGRFSSRLDWRAFAQYGRYDFKDIVHNISIASRIREAIDVITDPETGQPVCRSAEARAAGCRPRAIFGPNALASTPDAQAYYTHNMLSTAVNQQRVFGAQLSGELMDLPGGPLAFTAGLEYRSDSFRFNADGFAKLTDELVIFKQADQDASTSVKEAFAEVSLPLFKDVPLARYLELNGAVRYSDYKTGFKTTTWRLGGVYAPIEDIRFRVTRSRSIRAPNLFELFNANSSSALVVLDPCTADRIGLDPDRQANCAAAGVPGGWVDPIQNTSRILSTGGNLDLDPETSNALTIGAVVQPRFVKGLSVAVDYYDIKISDAITNIGVDDIYAGCFDLTESETALCDRITRDPGTHAITEVRTNPINFAAFHARGLDVSIDYATDAGTLWGKPLKISASLIGGYIFKNEYMPNVSRPENIFTGVGLPGLPRYRINASTTATLGQFSLGWSARYIPKTSALLDPPSDEIYDIMKYSSRMYHDLYFSADVNDRFKIGVGINNIFDSLVPYPLGGSIPGFYDGIGRRFFMTAGLKL